MMKRFNSSKVASSHHMTALTEKQKARKRAAKGIKARFAEDREASPYNAAKRLENADKSKALPRKEGYVPSQFKVRRSVRSGCVLSPVIREMVALRNSKREAFLKSLKV